jgi:bacillithiol biosynthesis deacetylase BshB1
LLAAVAEGKKVGIIDLTQGELGTRGTVADRLKEALLAGEIIGAAVRENLGMKDGFFVNDQTHQLMIVEVIRKYQPDIILCNAPEDRHPDHGKAAKLVADAAFLAGLVKVETTHNGVAQTAWRPSHVFHYIQSRNLQPNFVVDISAHMDQKMASILAHASQFYNPNSAEPNTFISSDSFLEFIKGRAKEFGQQVGVQYAEGFISEKMIGIHSFDGLIQKTT